MSSIHGSEPPTRTANESGTGVGLCWLYVEKLKQQQAAAVGFSLLLIMTPNYMNKIYINLTKYLSTHISILHHHETSIVAIRSNYNCFMSTHSERTEGGGRSGIDLLSINR